MARSYSLAMAARYNAQVAVLSLALFVVSIFLAAYSARNPGVARIGSVVLGEVLHPFQLLEGQLSGSVSSIWYRYIYLVGLDEENHDLRARLLHLEAQNSRLIEHMSENSRLRKLLSITEQSPLRGVGAMVIGYDPTNWSQTVSINKGLKDGLQVGMPVLEGDGVVGQIMAIGPTASKVLLVTDHLSGIDAIVQGGRMRGVIEGAGLNLARLRFGASEEEVKIGDRVITSGMDGVFPKGLLIGIVTGVRRDKHALFQLVDVQPSVDVARLEAVLVVTTPLTEVADITTDKKKGPK
jgi:rod shape-determining protein MreC